CVAGLDGDVVFHGFRGAGRERNLKWVLRIVAPRNQHRRTGLRSRAASRGDGVVQFPLAQQRINSWLLYFAENGDSLRRVFLDEDRNVRVVEKALLAEGIVNLRCGLLDGEPTYDYGAEHGQGNLAARTDAHFGFEIRHPV